MSASHICSCILTLLLLVVGGAQAQVPDRPESAAWKMYSVKGEDFAVALPTLPALHTTSQFLERIQKSRRIRQLGSYADGVAYVIHVFENPKPRQSLDSFIAERSTSKTSVTDVTVDGFRGVEFSDEYSIFQMFATEDRLYEFRAFGASADDARVKKFFSSLSLHKKTDAVNVEDGPGLPYEPLTETDSSNVDTSTFLVGKQVDRRARLAMKPEPSYTESARQNQITGTVVLKCVFAANGSVTNIRIVSGLPYGLTERAIDAARKIKFIPAMKDGKYVSMWMQLEYNFNLY
jgi:TonB family protein